MRLPLALALAFILAVVGARNGESQQRSCAGEPHRAFDFWLGTWEVFDRGSGKKTADVRVTSELDGCVIREEYEDATGLHGVSLSSYDTTAREWQQTWVTNRAQLLVIRGQRKGNAMAFSGWLREGGTETQVRATWAPEAGGVRETAERSSDGGKTWRPWFDLSFRRPSPKPADVAVDGRSQTTLWQPAPISSPQFESHAAFDPRTGDLYFVRSSPAFEGWRILVSRCGATGWSEPTAPAFAGDGVEADPAFTADGRTLYFISTRTSDGIRRTDLDLWRVDRDDAGRWGTPVRLPAPLNSERHEWFPRLSADGWLYFGSGRSGGVGKTDIWRARTDAANQWRVENLGESINSTEDEYEAAPSADGKRLVIATSTGVYESLLRDGRWSPRTRLGPEVNVNGSEIGPLLSPSGRSMLFARDTKTAASGEFFVWHTPPAESWPPSCR